MAEDSLARQTLEAAQRGDRVAFAACANRHGGGLDEARALVRSRGVVRMVDRVVTPEPVGDLELVQFTPTRAEGDEPVANGSPTMFGHFAVWDTWTEIDSWFEGHFMERLVKGSARKTMRENRDTIKSLFQHGMDPVAGEKPLGPIEELKEDDAGAYYEVPLLDVDYVRDLIPGLEAGLYGASFRFQVMREEFVDEPDPSDDNPRGLPERTVKEFRLFEFGPVTFPAYPEASANVRSYVLDEIEKNRDRVRELLGPNVTSVVLAEREEAPVDGSAEPGQVHPSVARRAERAPVTLDREEEESWPRLP